MAIRTFPLLTALFLATATAVAPPIAAPAGAAGGPQAVTVSEFAPGGWQVASGSATVATVSSPVTSGDTALRISYDTAGGQSVITTTRTSPELPGAPRSLSIDVLGDASWNVFYVELRDVTGEVFRYWMGTQDAGSLGFAGWRTLTAPIGASSPALVAHRAGDGDGVLDLPLSLYDLVVYPGPAPLKSASTIHVDRLTVITDPGPLVAIAPFAFVPAEGLATVRFRSADAGPMEATLTDTSGRSRVVSVDAPGGGDPVEAAWDGSASGGEAMRGLISARVRLARGGTTHLYDLPYAGGTTTHGAVRPPAMATGVSTFMTYIDTHSRAEVDRIATLAERAGVQYVRESFDWHQVEPARRGYFEWAKTDQAVAVARAHQLEILGRLQYTPLWATSAPSSVTGNKRYVYPPRQVADFAAYAREVVARYKDRIHVWQIWNEQNLAAMWQPSPNAAQYAELLKAAYAAIKTEDPTATVVLGGLSTGPDQGFLRGLRDAGAWGSFDVLAIHSFVNDDPFSSLSVFPGWIETAQETVAAWGDKPIWITEWGWSTYDGSLGVSETRQAVYTYHGFVVGARKGVDGMFLYSLEDYGTNRASLLDNYGTVTAAGRTKPSFYALQCSAAAIAGGNVPSCVVDGTRPVATSRRPTPGSAGIARDTRVTAVFSEGVKGVSSSRFRLRDLTSGTWVSASVVYDASTRKATLVPAGLLRAGHKHRASLSSGITDLSGNTLAATSWTFTVSRDSTRPKVVGRSPAAGTTGVSRTANVGVRFSEAMRASTVTATRVRLRDVATGAWISATVRYDAAGRRAILNPTTSLNARRTYQVVVSGTIRDRAGNVVRPTSWTFATGS